MIASAMIQKYCTLMFLLMTWNQCISSKTATNQLNVWLGCRVLIPCRRVGTRWDSFRWVYKENERSRAEQLYFLSKTGLTLYAPNRRATVSNDGSLIIDDFKEKDQGMYWCEKCDKNKCGSDQLDIYRVQKETLKEIQETLYITAGSSFTHTCPGGFLELKWTFEASNKPAQESKQIPETTVNVVNVKAADAGKYTCWASRCGGPSQKQLTVSLCVVEVVHHREDSSLSCFVTCDVDSETRKEISSLQVDNTIISVDVAPSGVFVCTAGQTSDNSATVTSTYTSASAVLNTTAGESEETENTFPAIYGVSITAACLAVTALMIFCFKSRLQAAFPFHSSCCGFGSKEEEENSTVIYSSLVIKAPPARRHRYACETDCIYGEIKV